MFKLKFAACLALIAGTLTVIIGFVHDARPLTLLYRTALSLVLFGITGYLIGSVCGKFLARLAITPPDSGTDNAGIPGEPHTKQQETSSSTPFTPFTPDNLAQIIKKQLD